MRMLFFSIHKVVWPVDADSDKIANLARHPKSLGTVELGYYYWGICHACI